MTRYLTVVPAYGRDYRTQKEVKQAWRDGKDFIVADYSSPDDGRYINTADVDSTPEYQFGALKIMARYSRLTKIVGVN